MRATLALTEYLARADEPPERIINFGTAGSLSGNTGIFEIDHVFQHDFDHKVIEQNNRKALSQRQLICPP